MANCPVFSVLLLYPDWLSYHYGKETYTHYTFVKAKNPKEAIQGARNEIRDMFGIDDSRETDFLVLLVTKGQHKDLTPFQ